MYRTLLFVALFAFLLPILRKLLLLGIAFYFFTRLELAKKFRDYVLPHSKGQIFSEAKAGTINFVMDVALLLGVTYLGWIHLAKVTLLDSVVTFSTMFVWFELWFYFTHRLYHHKAFFFIHDHHHKSKVTSVWTAFSFSILERSSLNLGAFGFAIVSSHLMPFSAVGFILYCVTSNVLNILLHSNVEFFPVGFAANRYVGWIFTPTFHALHHARYNQHYGLFTTIPDRLFNTLWADYPHVQTRAARGEGLKTLHEKVALPKPSESVVSLEETVVSPGIVPQLSP